VPIGGRALALAACAALLISTTREGQAQTSAPDGDQLLARAVNAPGLNAYSVPISLSVHLMKPIGIRAKVQAMAYYAAPAQSALVITKAGGIVGMFFKGAYKVDLVPQGWPATYRVIAVTQSVAGGVPVLLLRAVPRNAQQDITQVTFTLTTGATAAVGAQWQYRDSSSIHLSFVNEQVETYTLPGRATISVSKPRYRLDADATYGTYNLNVPIPAGVFSGAK
jgi:hypothetical protein